MYCAPFLFEPHPMYWRRTRCSSSPCGASPLLLLGFLLMFPCIAKMALWALCAFSSLAFYGFVAYVISSGVTALLDGSGVFDGFDGCCPCPAYKKTAADSNSTEEKETANKTSNEKATMKRPASSHDPPVEDEEAFTVTVCTPGVAGADLEVKLQTDESTPVLTVKGEACLEKVGPRSVQRTYCREYKLPKPVVVDKVSAVYADGILTVTLPKQRVPVRHIKIERAAPAPAVAAQSCTTASTTAAACSNSTKRRVLLSQIEKGVELRPTTATAVPVTAASPTDVKKDKKADAVAPAPNEWEVVQERAENIDCAILAELDEMGFTDHALNAELLAKHGGALNAVVKELVVRARASVTKTELAAAIDEAAG